MRLLTVEAEDWFGYVHLGVDFSNLTAVAITGANNHGKSAILDAITFCLYGVVGRKVSSRSNEAFIRAGADALLVRVTFATSDGKTVAVVRENERGATGALRLTVDDVEQTAGKISETQARIIDLIGLDYEALIASAFMVQHDSATFMNADPRDRKDLLIALLGLDQYEPLHKAAKAIADAATAERTAAEGQVSALSARVSEGPAARVAHALATETKTAAAGTLAAAREQIAQIREDFVAVRARRDAALAEVRRAAEVAAQRESLPEQITQLRDALREAEAANEEPEPQIQMPPAVPAGAIEDAEAARDNARMVLAERAGISQRVTFLGERLSEAEQARSVVDTVPCGAVGIYATCPLLAAIPSEEDIESVRASIERTEATLATLDGKEAEAAAAEAERQRLLGIQRYYERAQNGATIVRREWQARRTGAAALVAARRQALAAAERRAAELDREPDVEVSTEGVAAAEAEMARLQIVGKGLAETEREHTALLASAEQTLTAITRTLAVIEDAEAQVAEWRERAAKAADKGEVHAALAAAWHRDGVPTTIIERALPMIEAKANDVLSRLPEELIVTLRTQRPTKRGKGMAEKLDIVVSIDGFEREYGLLSWGARLRVDVALRIALGEILTHRSGQRIETLWLDEPLADLDPSNVEAMLELLTAIASDFPLMVVVSHHPTFSDAFASRIVVNKVDGISTAEVAA